jgi:hypothetical protein
VGFFPAPELLWHQRNQGCSAFREIEPELQSAFPLRIAGLRSLAAMAASGDGPVAHWVEGNRDQSIFDRQEKPRYRVTLYHSVNGLLKEIPACVQLLGLPGIALQVGLSWVFSIRFR